MPYRTNTRPVPEHGVETMNYPGTVIPFPSYWGSDEWLREQWEGLFPLASGDPDYCDEPCERAQAACVAIEKELIKRGKPIKLGA